MRNRWTRANRLYIKWFLVWQPLPSRIAWYLYNYLPDIAFEAMHIGTIAWRVQRLIATAACRLLALSAAWRQECSWWSW
eukprot:SAG11_NODE_1740_length_4338_cov_2.608634_5_plen_79_part_00